MSKPPRIELFGEIDDEKAHAFIKEFWELEHKTKKGEILVLIDSEGGSVRQALTLYDTLKSSAVPTFGLVLGNCLSAATLVLQGCTRRAMFPSSTFMMHRGSASTGHVYEREFEATFRRCREEEQLFQTAVFSRCKVSRQDFEKLNNKGRYLTAEEAVHFGFADAVVKRRFYRSMK